MKARREPHAGEEGYVNRWAIFVGAIEGTMVAMAAMMRRGQICKERWREQICKERWRGAAMVQRERGDGGRGGGDFVQAGRGKGAAMLERERGEGGRGGGDSVQAGRGRSACA